MTLISNALTTLAAVKDQLGISVSTYDTVLESFINSATNQIEKYCNRTFKREAITEEKVYGNGTKELFVSRVPIDTSEDITVTYNDNEIDSTDYEVSNAENGTLFNLYDVWNWTASYASYMTQDGYPGSERKSLYKVSYTGGYYLPDNVSRDLPYDLEQACIDLVVMKYSSLGQDPSIKEESLLDYSYKKFGGDSNQTSASEFNRSIPPSIKDVLDYYVVYPINKV